MTTQNIRYLNDVRQRAKSRSDDLYFWVHQLNSVATSLRDETKSGKYEERWLEVSLFYVRLFGAVDEIPRRFGAVVDERYAKREAVEKELEQFSPSTAAFLRDVFEKEKRFVEAARELLTALSKEERVALWQRRHKNCHVFVDTDGVRLKNGAEVDVTTVLGTSLTVAELDDARNRMNDSHTDEFEGATHLARRLQRPIKELLDACAAFYAAPSEDTT